MVDEPWNYFGNNRMDLTSAETVLNENEAIELTAAVMGVQPLRALRQPLSNSGKAIFRMDLPDNRSVALRTSVRPKTFAFTRHNLEVLRLLGLPVPIVLSAGSTGSGGSYIFLSWLPGQDLVYELAAMNRSQMSRLAEQWVDCQRRVGKLPEAARFGWAPIGRSGTFTEWTQVFGESGSTTTEEDRTALAPLRARLRSVRADLESYFRSVRPLCFLDDLTVKNLLVADGELTGIIDVDFVCYGDPLLALGTTLCGIVSDVGPAGEFYGEELIRFWAPLPEQLRALRFYAALWAIGVLSMTDATAEPARAMALTDAAGAWLRLAETGDAETSQPLCPATSR
jgi:aminoglycoside phosphotransferase (APT) family kinase protein